jgi:hypothetical protein
MYLALCLTAIVFAMHAPAGQRRGASATALALVCNWLICRLSYTGPGFTETHYLELWTAADLVFGLTAIALGFRHWWGWAFLGFAIAQQLCHLTHTALGASVYLDALDGLLRAQIAVFILIGGKGVADRLYRAVDRGWHVLRASDSAFQKHRP